MKYDPEILRNDLIKAKDNKDINILSENLGLSKETIWNIISARTLMPADVFRTKNNWETFMLGLCKLKCNEAYKHFVTQKPEWFFEKCKSLNIELPLPVRGSLDNDYLCGSHEKIIAKCRICLQEIKTTIKAFVHKNFGITCLKCQMSEMSAKAQKVTKVYAHKNDVHIINRLYRKHLGDTNAAALLRREKGKEFVVSLFDAILEEASKDDVPIFLRPHTSSGRVLDHCHKSCLPRRYISNQANCAEGLIKTVIEKSDITPNLFLEKYGKYLGKKRMKFDCAKDYISIYEKSNDVKNLKSTGNWGKLVKNWSTSGNLPKYIENYLKQPRPTRTNLNSQNYAAYIALAVECKEKSQSFCEITGLKENNNNVIISLDHCHETGMVRGWILKEINSLEGFLNSISKQYNCSQIEVIKQIFSYMSLPLSQNYFLIETAKLVKTYKNQ